MFIAGGGLAYCMSFFDNMEEKADEYHCVAATFDYRSMPCGGGYPMTLNDCHAAYQYLVDHAEELHIHPGKIVLYGGSSGGHLALCLCHRLKRYRIKPRGCMVTVPVLEDRLEQFASTKIRSNGWGRGQIEASAKIYLGADMDLEHVPAEAFANRATVEECAGLPPTIIHTCANDTSFDPCMNYASKLNEAGVYVSLFAWGGSNHDGLYMSATTYDKDNPDARYAQTFNHVLRTGFLDLLEYDLGRSWLAEEEGEEG